MEYATCVEVVKCPRCLIGDVGSSMEGQRSLPLHTLPQIGPRDVLHDNIQTIAVTGGIVDFDQVTMFQRGDQSDLCQKTLDEIVLCIEVGANSLIATCLPRRRCSAW